MSYIILDFESVPPVNTVITIYEATLGLTITETIKFNRVGSNQVKRPPYVAENDRYIGFVSTNFKNAFNADYNPTNIFFVTWTEGEVNTGTGTVTIEANYANAVFSVLSGGGSGITFTIENDVTPPSFSIENLVFQEASASPCSNIGVSVETNELAVNVLEPFILNGNTDNPLIFDFLRGQTFNLKLQDISGNIAEQQVTTPPVLSSANFFLTVNFSPYGSTVIITNQNSEGLELEYSLDGSTWQDENVFPSLLPDDYTLYVRDQYGCSFEQIFSINDTQIYTPFFYISKSNSIRYAQRVDASNIKNDENTLSCEVPYTKEDVKFKEIQLFQSNDVVKTQFKSNFTTNTVTVIKEDGSTNNITVVKKSQNIGATDKRDAIKYDRGNGKTGIYFTTGNIYDYVTDIVTETYSLNGYLPYWATPGNYLSIGAAFYLIEDIVFDELKNARVIVIDNIYTGIPANIIVGSRFNFFPYEVYEFEIDMLDYLDQNVRVKIECTDPNFDDISYLSELINVKVNQENTVEIRYKNTTNTDVFYETGIEFLIRQEIIKISALTIEDFENNQTDSNVTLLSGDVFEGDQFDFEPVTKEMYRKIVRALSHEVVFINKVGYVKNDNIDFENQGESNIYTISAKMIKTGQNYTSQAFGIGSGLYNGENLNIPGLVDYNGGFVQY